MDITTINNYILSLSEPVLNEYIKIILIFLFFLCTMLFEFIFSKKCFHYYVTVTSILSLLGVIFYSNVVISDYFKSLNIAKYKNHKFNPRKFTLTSNNTKQTGKVVISSFEKVTIKCTRDESLKECFNKL